MGFRSGSGLWSSSPSILAIHVFKDLALCIVMLEQVRTFYSLQRFCKQLYAFDFVAIVQERKHIVGTGLVPFS